MELSIEFLKPMELLMHEVPHRVLDYLKKNKNTGFFIARYNSLTN